MRVCVCVVLPICLVGGPLHVGPLCAARRARLHVALNSGSREDE